MKVLVLSLDKGLSVSGQSDTEFRYKEYANYLDGLFVLVSGADDSFRTIKHNIVIRTIGGSKPRKLFKIIAWGVWLSVKENINLIVTNDAALGFVGWIIKTLTGKAKLNVNVLGLEIASSQWLEQRPLINRIVKIVQIFSLRRADSIRTDSQADAARLFSMGIKKERVFYLPVIPSKAAILRLEKSGSKVGQKKIARKKNTLLCVGDLIFQKGHEVLFRALKEVANTIPTVKLIIVGDGPEKEKLQKLADEFGLHNNIRFEGKVMYAKLPQYYLSSNILVVSSWYEGGPRVVMEAAFCGLPVVSTDIGSVRDMLTDGKSVSLCPPGDTKVLSQKICELLSNPKKQNEYAQNALRQIKTYCQWEKNLQGLLNIWKATVK